MKITDLLKKNGIALNPKVGSKEEAINKLVDLMDVTGRLRDKEAYKKAYNQELTYNFANNDIAGLRS